MDALVDKDLLTIKLQEMDHYLIPHDYAISVKGMAGLRNLLVHEYSEIDNEKLAAFVNVNLNDFYLLCQYIAAYVDKN